MWCTRLFDTANIISSMAYVISRPLCGEPILVCRASIPLLFSTQYIYLYTYIIRVCMN